MGQAETQALCIYNYKYAYENAPKEEFSEKSVKCEAKKLYM
jgi:hypothetical protein